MSRTVTRTTPCSTSSPFGRPCRCSARPFLVHLPTFLSLTVTNHALIAGEMLCKYYIVLVRNFSADRSSSQFKASCPSCTPSFDRSATLPRLRFRMTALSTSYSLLLAGVALSFGSPPSAILPEPPYGQICISHPSSLIFPVS